MAALVVVPFGPFREEAPGQAELVPAAISSADLPVRRVIPVASMAVPDTVGITLAADLVAAPDGDRFWLVTTDEESGLDVSAFAVTSTGAAVPQLQALEQSEQFPTPPASPAAVAFDSASDRLVAAAADSGRLVRSSDPGTGVGGVETTGTGSLAARDGLVIDRRRNLAFGLEESVLSTATLDPATGGVGEIIRRVDLTPLASGELRGLGADPVSGALYVGDLADGRVLETGPTGTPVGIIELGSAASDPAAMAVAAGSGAAAQERTTSLYLLDRGISPDDPAQVLELDLSDVPYPVGMSVIDRPDLIRTIEMGAASPPGSDPSGLAWLPDTAQMLVTDSEIEEYPSFAGVNVWTVGAEGAVEPVGATTNWSQEPTGATAGPDGSVLVSDDVAKVINQVTPGPDKKLGTGDDIVRTLTTAAFGSFDPEDVAYDPASGRLYVADGAHATVFVIDPGPDGQIGGEADNVVTQFGTRVADVLDPEGIVYDPDTDSLIVVDYADGMAVQFGPEGAVLRQLDLGAAAPIHPASVAITPSPDGSGRILWVADRGLDGEAAADGRIYQLSLPPLAGGSPAAGIEMRSAVSFPLTAVGTPANADLTVSNQGTAPLHISQLDILDDGSGSPFTLRSPGELTIPAGGSRSISIAFEPDRAGDFSARLSVQSDDRNRPRVVVSLYGSAS